MSLDFSGWSLLEDASSQFTLNEGALLYFDSVDTFLDLEGLASDAEIGGQGARAAETGGLALLQASPGQRRPTAPEDRQALRLRNDDFLPPNHSFFALDPAQPGLASACTCCATPAPGAVSL
jgi:hypothetical protein